MSHFDASKRQLFQKASVIRLPWAVEEQAFTDGCTRCGDCINACPEKIIVKGRGGFPMLSFANDGCTLCQKCVQACDEPIFRPLNERGLLFHATISDQCFPKKGIECRSCAQACEANAIRFQFGANRLATPQLITDDCTGCGACLSICPADALSLTPSSDLTKISLKGQNA